MGSPQSVAHNSVVDRRARVLPIGLIIIPAIIITSGFLRRI